MSEHTPDAELKADIALAKEIVALGIANEKLREQRDELLKVAKAAEATLAWLNGNSPHRVPPSEVQLQLQQAIARAGGKGEQEV